jgi:hypothetical protein
MPEDKNKKIIDLFHQLDWPNLKFEDKGIFITKNRKKLPLLSINDKEVDLSFYWYDARGQEYNLRNDINSIKFNNSVDIGSVLKITEREYRLPLIYLIKNILDLEKSSDINKIELTKNKKDLAIDSKNKILKIGFDKYWEILNEARVIYKRVKSHKLAYERYLTNLAIEKFSSRAVERKTLISPGDINFTVQRLNLQTKKKKSDFNSYINKADVNSVEDLTTAFIKNEMFDDVFLRKLNDYFIKENLQDIIKLGQDILSLRSPKLDTDIAKEVIFKVNGDKRKVKQLETLWQNYFKKYLLFLIFSYKGIFPKIELTDVEGDKKYPDFIGINHYNGVDIIEIKTHLKNALVYDKGHKNFAFSSELSKAIIQTMNYMDAVIHTNFKKSEDKEKITNSSHEENLNRPRGIIIISSYDKLVSNYQIKNKEKIIRDFTKLRNSVHNIEILTFDEILGIAHDYIQNIITKDEEVL